MKRSKLVTVIAVSGLLATASCGGSSNDTGGTTMPSPTPSATATSTTGQRIQQLEASGALPSLDRSDSLLGPDVDNNGIRDDVDTFINGMTASTEQKASLRQLARSFQSSLSVSLDNRTAIDASQLATARGVRCIYSRFPASQGASLAGDMARTIESVTFNTRPRLLAEVRMARIVDGSVLPSPEGDTCD